MGEGVKASHARAMRLGGKEGTRSMSNGAACSRFVTLKNNDSCGVFLCCQTKPAVPPCISAESRQRGQRTHANTCAAVGTAAASLCTPMVPLPVLILLLVLPMRPLLLQVLSACSRTCTCGHLCARAWAQHAGGVLCQRRLCMSACRSVSLCEFELV